MAEVHQPPAASGDDPDQESGGIDDIDDLLASLTSSNGSTPAANQKRQQTERLSSGGLIVGGLVGLAIAAIVGSLVLSWVALSRSGGDEVASTTEAGDGQDGDALSERVEGVLASLGLAGITAEQRDDAVILTGTVATESQRQQVIDATAVLADGKVIDASGLAVDTGQTTVDSAPPAAPSAVEDGRRTEYQTALDRLIAATPIIFAAAQSDLTDQHKRILDTVASTMKDFPEYPVTVVGFTDDRGEDAANEALSQRRAVNVADYLEVQGVAEGVLLTDPRGEEASTGSSRIAGLERRVEFEVGSTTNASVAVADTVLRIALIAPSARDDLAFTQSMVEAIDELSDERGKVEVDVVDGTFVVPEAEAAIREFAADDVDLIIAHGSQYGPALFTIAQEFPEIAFVWGTASDTFGLPNVYAYDVASEQGGYVLGAVSALVSKSGTLGIVGPIEVGDAERYVRGFTAGARAERPQTDIRATWTGSFSDSTLAAEAALEHVDAGADVMTGSAQMVVGAVSVAQENGSFWVGNQADQTSLAPELVLGSQVYRWEAILRPLIADLDAGTLDGRDVTATIANGGIEIVFNPDFPLDPEIRARAEELIVGISSGSIVVPT